MSTICNQCQAIMEENAKFCPQCGKATEVQVVEADRPILERKNEFEFLNKKYIGSFNYSTDITTVCLKETAMKIRFEKKPVFGSKKFLYESDVAYAEIRDIVLKKTFQKWFVFFVILMMLIGTANHWFWILAALLLYQSYGKKVFIVTNKTVVKLPTSAERDLDDLVTAIRKINPSIFVSQ